MRKNTIASRIKTCIAKIKAKRKDELRKKILDLYQASYEFYLDKYLKYIKPNNIVDLPDFLYLSGKVVCKTAADKALKVVIDYAISKGVRGVNRCHKCLLKSKKSV